MKIPFGKPIIDHKELNKIKNVLLSGILTHGPISKNFEESFSKFTGLRSSLSTSSCTASLYMAYKLIGLKKGDEFLVPAQTHVATVNSGKILGATPVFIDSDISTGNIDIHQIEKKITKKTKCLTIVHFLGKPVDIKKIRLITKKYKIKLIEDCALALGSKYYKKHVGFFSDFACFSFYPAKHITTGDGGMLFCKNKNDYERAKLLRGFGVNKSFFERKTPGIYDVLDCGLNFRLSDINSALGVVQLKKIDKFLKDRKRNYLYLSKKIKENSKLELINTDSEKDLISSYYCLSFMVKGINREKRNKYLNLLVKKGIGCSVYYPRTITDYTYYKKKNYDKMKYPNARKISNNSICLPVGPHLTFSNLEFMSSEIKKIFI
jgi:perosamine synthetase